MKILLVTLGVFFHVIVNGYILREGTPCRDSRQQLGVCKKLDSCRRAITDLDRHQIWPTICQHETHELPVVCCVAADRDEEVTTHKTTSAIPTLRHNNIRGAIAWQKCQEYSEWAVEEPPILSDNDELKINIGKCFIDFHKLIIGGNETSPGEFPHMARLGFGLTNVQWLCGGSLISDSFILTAAHCIQDSRGEPVSWALLGDTNILDYRDTPSPLTVKIIERIPHPEYSSPKSYNDIALLRLERPVTFTDYIRPACVQTRVDYIPITTTAIGWGATKYNGSLSDSLMKVDLPVLSFDQCSKIYASYAGDRKLPYGLDSEGMLCAGETGAGKDSCQGDSGGPLQVVLKQPHCMYSIVGVTCGGYRCGLVPGIYTKVAKYIDWIEQNVWP